MTLSELNHNSLLLLVSVAGFWFVNLGLRLARHRLYWVTFWVLCAGLPAMAIYWFATPWNAGTGFDQAAPRQWVLGALALALWFLAMALDLIVFIVFKFRERRRPAMDRRL